MRPAGSYLAGVCPGGGMVDAEVSNTSGANRAGSSPAPGTTFP